MSSTLYWDRLKDTRWMGSSGCPLKNIIAKKFFDHDGSLCSGQTILTAEHVGWLEGLVDCGIEDADKILEDLKELGSISVWIG